MPLECATHPWSTLSECTTLCGPGTRYRTRAYKDPDLAASFNCQVVLRQTQKCVGEQCGVPDVEPDEDEAAGCELTPWTGWSSCSRGCGHGYMTRSREYINPYEREKCLVSWVQILEARIRYLDSSMTFQNDNPVELEQRQDCEGFDCVGRRTQESRGEDDDGNSNANLAVADIERNDENDDNNMEEEEKGVVDDDTSLLPQPELFERPRPEFPNRRKILLYDERQTNWGENGNFDRTAEGDGYDNWQIDSNDDKYEQEGEENNNELNAGDTYNHPYDNRGGLGRWREQNRYSDGASSYDSYNRDREKGDADNKSNLREVYDENGHKAIFVEASDPNSYDVLQQFCFDKPYTRTSHCERVLGFRNYWFYDADERQCQIFTTDNCDQNKNKFRTLSACEGVCLLPHSLQISKSVSNQDNDNRWSRQFGEAESLIKKPKRKGRRRNRKRKQKDYVGNIRMIKK